MGCVLATGPVFFLLALVDENIRFNDFQCLRLQDVRRLEMPAACSPFKKTALKLRGDKRPRTPRVSVQSIKELLEKQAESFR